MHIFVTRKEGRHRNAEYLINISIPNCIHVFPHLIREMVFHDVTLDAHDDRTFNDFLTVVKCLEEGPARQTNMLVGVSLSKMFSAQNYVSRYICFYRFSTIDAKERINNWNLCSYPSILSISSKAMERLIFSMFDALNVFILLHIDLKIKLGRVWAQVFSWCFCCSSERRYHFILKRKEEKRR